MSLNQRFQESQSGFCAFPQHRAVPCLTSAGVLGNKSEIRSDSGWQRGVTVHIPQPLTHPSSSADILFLREKRTRSSCQPLLIPQQGQGQVCPERAFLGGFPFSRWEKKKIPKICADFWSLISISEPSPPFQSHVPYGRDVPNIVPGCHHPTTTPPSPLHLLSQLLISVLSSAG